MSKVPYIPLYIGDWEQDTNCISLQAEAAWLKIIFKMFRNDKSGIYKTSTKSLQNLWKSDTNGVQDIIKELQENNICDFEIDDMVTFFNRRMIKEKEISNIRSNSVQTRYKTPTKKVQNTEYENEDEDVIEVKDVVKDKKNKRKKFTIPSLEEVREYAQSEMIGSVHLPEKFHNYYESNGWKVSKNPMRNWKATFKNWVINEKDGTHQQVNGQQFTGKVKPNEMKKGGYNSAQTLTKDEENLMQCVASPKIEFSHDSHIIAVLKVGAFLMGMKIEKMESDVLMALHVENIRNNHSTVRLKELKLAFEMAAAFKLDFSPKTYQNFSPIYVNELLLSYKRWASATYQTLKPGSDVNSEIEKSDWSYRIYDRQSVHQLRADIQEGYSNYRKGIISSHIYIPFDWWAVLVEDGFIEYDENATVYENTQVSKLDADQKRKLKNGQQMVWLLFQMAERQGNDKLYIAE